MLHSDKSLLALLLLRIHLRCGSSEPTYEEFFDHLLQRSDALISDEATSVMQGEAACISLSPLSNTQKVALLKLTRLSDFKDCIKKAQSSAEFSDWVTSDKLEMNVIQLWNTEKSISIIV